MSEPDALVYMPMERWPEIQAAFKLDWPRGVSAYWALETQKQWLQQGLTREFSVYCPFGEPKYGMVAVTKMVETKMIIQCPTDDTSYLEDALRKTKLINWKKRITVPFPPNHISECVMRILKDINMRETGESTPHVMFLLDGQKPLFEIRLPEGVTIDLLKEDHIDLVNSSWVNRYKGSDRYLQILVNAKYGYGIFKDKEMAAWVFIDDGGALMHLFTLPNHRKKGYAEMIFKFVCNSRLRDKKDSFAYCMRGNDNAIKLYLKLGFVQCHTVFWRFLVPLTSNL